jgi:hypothetical protein
MKEGKKRFFFEKKKQKTFVLGLRALKTARARGAKVFCGGGPPGHFFQKSDLL